MQAEHRIARLRPLDADAERPDLGDDDALMDDLDNVMSFLKSPRRAQPGATKARGGFDLDGALEMVVRASEAMDVMERRSQEVQSQADALVEQARREVVGANAKVAALQERVLDALARADELEERLEIAEERAREADEWLGRFHDTITNAFSARRTAAVRKAA